MSKGKKGRDSIDLMEEGSARSYFLVIPQNKYEVATAIGLQYRL